MNNLNDILVRAFMGGFSEKEYTPEEVQNKLTKYERNLESNLKEALLKFNISAKIKSIPNSLPHNGELEMKFIKESYVNMCFDQSRIFYIILKHIMENDLRDFRFYIKMEIITPNKSGITLLDKFGYVKYLFRYHNKYKNN